MRLIKPVAVAAILAFGAAGLRADTTATTHIHVTLSDMLQAMAASKGHEIAPSALSDVNIITQVKGQLGRIQLPGGEAVIVDLAKGQVTMLDPKHMRYSVAPLSEIAHQAHPTMHAPTPSAKAQAMMAQFHIATSFSPTGQTDTLLGVPVAETDGKLTVTRNPPNGGAPLPFGTVDMQFWTATPVGAMTPQIAEMQRFAQAAGAIFGMQQQLASMFQNLPMGGAQLTSFLNDVQNTLSQKVTLKMQMDVVSPVLVKLMAAAAAMQGQPSDNADPNAPVMQFTSTTTSLSSASIPDSAFTVPAGYTLAPSTKN